MSTQNFIGSTLTARVVAVQSYGLILEADGNQIVILAPDVADFDKRNERYKPGDLVPVRILRRNQQTGQLVGQTV